MKGVVNIFLPQTPIEKLNRHIVYQLKTQPMLSVADHTNNAIEAAIRMGVSIEDEYCTKKCKSCRRNVISLAKGLCRSCYQKKWESGRIYKPKFDAVQLRKMKKLYSKGMGTYRIAKVMGTYQRAIYVAMKADGVQFRANTNISDYNKKRKTA